MTLLELELLIKHHDMTYIMSDNDSVFENGLQELELIKKEAMNFPQEQVAEIWNKYVIEKINEDHRDAYFWNKNT